MKKKKALAHLSPFQFGDKHSSIVNFILNFDEPMKNVRKVQKYIARGEFVDKIEKAAQSDYDDFDARFPEGEKRELLFLANLINATKEDSKESESLYQESLSSLEEGILRHLAKVSGNALLEEIEDEVHYELDHLTQASYFLNLLDLDFNIQLAALRIMKESNIDLNELPSSLHPLVYLFPSSAEQTQSPFGVSNTTRINSPLETKKLLIALFEAGVIITPEVDKAMKDGKIDKDKWPMIRQANYLAYQKIIADVYLVLPSSDVSTIVMGYVIDALTQALAQSRRWEPVPSVASEPLAFFSGEGKHSLPPAERKLRDLFEEIKSESDKSKPVAVMAYAWLDRADAYVTSLEKSAFNEKPLDEKQQARYEEFKLALGVAKEEMSKLRSDDGKAIDFLIGFQTKIPEFFPPLLREQITGIVEKMQQRSAPEHR